MCIFYSNFKFSSEADNDIKLLLVYFLMGTVSLISISLFDLVVTSVLDMMVPVHFRPTRRKEKHAPDLDVEDQAIVTCSNVVLGHLKKRYFWIVMRVGIHQIHVLYIHESCYFFRELS